MRDEDFLLVGVFESKAIVGQFSWEQFSLTVV